MLRQWWKRHTDDADEGATTAEFAVVLPCVAAVATIRRELDSSLKTLGVVAMQCGVAWLVSLAAYALAGLW